MLKLELERLNGLSSFPYVELWVSVMKRIGGKQCIFIECIMDSIVVSLRAPLPPRTVRLTRPSSQHHVLVQNVRRVAGDSRVHAPNLANALAGVPVASLIITGKSGLCFLMIGYIARINCLAEQSQRVWVTFFKIIKMTSSLLTVFPTVSTRYEFHVEQERALL